MKKIVLLIVSMIFCLISFSQEAGTFTDSRDGQVYNTIKIGTQVWMAKNFAYKPVNGNYFWKKTDSTYVPKYGYLYDLKTALEIAPSGWHIPTKNEWKMLYDYLGGNNKKVYISMIEGGNSGFNALLGGLQTNIGLVDGIGQCTGYWSSTRFGLGAYGISFTAPYARSSGFVSIGIVNSPSLCVRLIKDN